MREIKFRAWNGSIFRYYPIGMSIYHIERFEITQYTGLKDKNGVEIYEGDIANSHIFGLCEVRYFKNAFVLWTTAGDFTRGSNYLHDGCEVIGNIHENPELLEAQNE